MEEVETILKANDFSFRVWHVLLLLFHSNPQMVAALVAVIQKSRRPGLQSLDFLWIPHFGAKIWKKVFERVLYDLSLSKSSVLDTRCSKESRTTALKTSVQTNGNPGIVLIVWLLSLPIGINVSLFIKKHQR